MKVILFVSRHTPSTEQVTLAGHLGFNIRHVGDFNAFAPLGEFSNFLQKKREEATAWDDTGVFGIEQRDIVVCAVHPALAIQAIQDGYTVVCFESTLRQVEGELNVKPSFTSIHFFDPMPFAAFVRSPYTPPVIEERQVDESPSVLVDSGR